MDVLHNKIVMDALFDLATWYTYTKLRLHTDKTLSFFREATTNLGDALRKFNKDTCSIYNTQELPHETAA
ncbi:hypothetical protein OF83DRAFT_1070454, partial [Amylostereum chailletii]